MQLAEITVSTILNAFRHRWKFFLIVVLVFVVLGIGAAFLFSEQLAAPADGGAELLEPANFSEVYLDADYYTACQAVLTTRVSELETVLNRVSSESTLTEDQLLTLEDLQRSLEAYRRTDLAPIEAAWAAPDALYIPEDFIEETIAEYTISRENTQNSLYAAEFAVELISTMDAPDVGTEDINSTYAALLSRAAQYAQLQLTLQSYDILLDRLTNDRTEVVADGHWMEQQLETAKDNLNDVEASINQTVNGIAEENHLNITAEYVGTEVQVTIDHTHGLSTSREAAQILVIFCTLTGICVGMYLAICIEIKKNFNVSR